MKKLILCLLLLCSTFGISQTQTFNSPPKFKNVAKNNPNVKILSLNTSTNLLQYVEKESISALTDSPAMMQDAGIPSTNSLVPNFVDKHLPRNMFYYDNTGLDLYVMDYGSSDWVKIGAGIADAPVDGQKYVRQNAAWVVAPSSNLGYKNYIIQMTQSSTTAPTIFESLNTTSQTITWSRLGVGHYQFTVPSGLGIGTYSSKVIPLIFNIQEFGSFPSAYFSRKFGIQINGNGLGGLTVDVFFYDSSNVSVDLNGTCTMEVKFINP